MSILELVSPLTGRSLALSASPDPVFAGGLLGDGVAIDPSVGELRAPCAGTVVATRSISPCSFMR